MLFRPVPQFYQRTCVGTETFCHRFDTFALDGDHYGLLVDVHPTATFDHLLERNDIFFSCPSVLVCDYPTNRRTFCVLFIPFCDGSFKIILPRHGGFI